MKKKNKRLRTLILFIIPVFIGSGIIFYNLRDNMVFFYSPTEILTKNFINDGKIRLGGMVKKNSIIKESILLNGNNVEEVSFIVTDFENEINVKFVGILPDLCKEGQGGVVEGKIDNLLVLKATEVLAKHDENYMPPEIQSIKSINERENDL